MRVLAVCCTFGRHTQLERAVRCFINQDYEGDHTLLIYNSSEVAQHLDKIDLPDNKHIIVVNCINDRKTGNPYNNVGAKYRDAVDLFSDYDVFTSFDDDDIFLSNHISEGVKGLQMAIASGMKAYKPMYSYFKTSEGIKLVNNTLEPSIFVLMDHIKEKGFAEVSVEYHQQWLDPLVAANEIFVDEFGKPTFCYTWVGEVFKMSGNPNNPNNFQDHAKHSIDHGDGVITPVSDELIKDFIVIKGNEVKVVAA